MGRHIEVSLLQAVLRLVCTARSVRLTHTVVGKAHTRARTTFPGT